MSRIDRILANVRDVLNDHSKQRWSDERLLRLLDEGQRDISRHSRILKGQCSIELVDGEVYYTLPELCWLITRVTYNGQNLPFVSHAEMDSRMTNWESRKGNSVSSIVITNGLEGKLRVYPVPDGDIGTLEVQFIRLSRPLFAYTPGDVFEHNNLEGRDAEDAHPIGSITGLTDALSNLQDHRELNHRDAEDSHPIEAISGLPEALSDLALDIATQSVHNNLTDRDAEDAHPISSITGLTSALAQAGQAAGLAPALNMVIKYTVKGQPCVFYSVPKYNIEDLGVFGYGSGPHPAFIDNDVEIPRILVAAYPAAIIDGELVSQPGLPPVNDLTFAQAKQLAEDSGFELMRNWDWAAISLWCMANDYQPRGNTLNGKSHSHRWETGVVAGDVTLAGSGPAAWRHNGIDGIADMVGNTWEWVDGLRLVGGVYEIDGELYSTAPAEGAFSTLPPEDFFSVVSGSPAAPTHATAYSETGFLLASTSSSTVTIRVLDGALTTVTSFSGTTAPACGFVRLPNNDIALVYADGGTGNLRISDDEGATWSARVPIPAGNSTRTLTSLLSGTVIAFSTESSGATAVARCVRSVDNGWTWDSANQVPGFAIVEGAVEFLGSLYAFGGTRQISTSSGAAGRVAVSTDEGLTWANVYASGRQCAGLGVFGQYLCGIVDISGTMHLLKTADGVLWETVALTGSAGVTRAFTLDYDGNLAVAANNYLYIFDSELVSFQRVSIPVLMSNPHQMATHGRVTVLAGNNSTVNANTMLIRESKLREKQALLLPGGLNPSGSFFSNTTGERYALRGGGETSGDTAGLGALSLTNDENGTAGCRLRCRED